MHSARLLNLLCVFAVASALVGVSVGLLAPTPARSQVFKPDGDDGNTHEDKREDETTDRGDDKKKKKDRDRDHEKKVECGTGKVSNPDTLGHCCWPGQAWNGQRCVGVPTRCPDGFESQAETESCELPECPVGQQRVDGVHCCWPGQAWATTRGLCLGEPDCPADFERDGSEACKPIAAGLRGSAANSEYGKLISIPAGEFTMGCKQSVDRHCESDEKPYNTVSVSEFEIDRTEVPVSAYALCVQDGSCTEPATGPYCNYHTEERQEHPVNCVSWTQANAFCTWAGKRLPSEAEWEKAARSDTIQTWPWGNSAGSCSQANQANCGDTTMAIASLPDGASPYGVLDMSGNVAEWVGDWYAKGAYGSRPDADPRGPESGTKRVARGGSFQSDSKHVRTTARQGQEPSDASRDLGFRCARSVR